MGDHAIVSALVKDVLGRLTSEDIKEFGMFCGFKDDVLALKDDFERSEAVLQDAEENHDKEKAVELWLKSLKSASLEVEDVLDEISTEAMIQRLHKERGVVSSVSAFFSYDHNPLMFQVRIAYKVKAVRTKLDTIASKIFELKLAPLSHLHDVEVASEMPDRETSSIIHSSTIIGRTSDMNVVIDKICNKDIGKHDEDKIRVYGIWGVGGVGKTTLARLVYNHERVNQYFDFKFWIHVPGKLSGKKIIKGIIESINKCECGFLELDMLKESLQSKLRGKKFLIVLDDIWIEDNDKSQWDHISETISCGVEGSIVLITTQYQTTSQMMAKIPDLQHNLGCLSEEESLLLFKKLAFAKGRKDCDVSELESIGREIVEKCKGLPLAVKTLGSLMWTKNTVSDWQHVKDNKLWGVQENNILPALNISYDNLPPHIKRCFAYSCLFPKGYDMEKDELIPLWVLNGFIPSRGERDLYAIGEEIFDCLVWRSFISKVKKLSGDKYIMHDLMHDMAQHVMGDDCLVLEPEKDVTLPNEVFHMSSSCAGFIFSPQDLEKLTSLRSVFMYGKMNEGAISQISKHAYLRVLYLRGIRLKTLPQSICKLKHLKYLNLSNSSLEILPDSIIYLQNLQALLLYSCKKLHELPESIFELKHLAYMNLSHSSIEVLPDSIIHIQNLQVLLLGSCLSLSKLPEGLKNMRKLQLLDINQCHSLTHLPTGIKELTRLRILSLFHLGNMSGAKIGELHDLNLLEGELQIMPLESVGGFGEAKSANLKGKRNLQVLFLRWSGVRMPESTRGRMRVAHDEEVLEGLEPNSSLKELKISYYMGKTISPSWMVNLRNLVEISFYYCTNCEHIPPLGRLPSLRVIDLSYMDSLKRFHDDKENMTEETTNMFLCLQKLNIYNCQNLVSLPSNLPKLEVLKLDGCDALLSLPDEIHSFKNLNKLVIIRCKLLSKRCEREIGVDWPKIAHIPNIYQD